MKLMQGNLSYRFAASIVLLLSCPLQAMASGTEARRAYITGDHLKALELAKPAAENGDSAAMLVLGMLYFQGEGLRRDYTAALRWWRAAAELGNVRAHNNIGTIFREGHGVERNYEEAIAWYELAAAKGEAYAHWNLGLMHENGQGFSVDVAKALSLYKLSVDLFRQELLAEPENHKVINRWIDVLNWRINWLTNMLSKPKPSLPMPNTPQSSTGQQTTPR